MAWEFGFKYINLDILILRLLLAGYQHVV